MARLEKKSDDCTDDENRLESFAEDDEEGLEERFPAPRRALSEVDHRWQAVGDRVARRLGTIDVFALYRALEVGEVSLHGGDEPRLLGARRGLQRLEGDV